MDSILKVDKPINKKDEDFLGRKDFAEAVTNAIINSNVEDESLTIGLYGKWGSGKTSIINMILEDIEKEEDILVFKFEPWLYSDTEQLISQFFKDFAKIINHKDSGQEAKRIGKELESYATFFDAMSLIPEPTTFLVSQATSKIFKTVGKASSKWGELKSKNLSQIKSSIETHLKKFDKKILIVIDDIDRLNNTEVRQIFQLIKSLGNFPNTIYIASMDREVVVDALSEVQKGDGSEYLEKIVHVPLNVPSISNEKVHQFLFFKLDEIVTKLDEKEFDKNYWGNIYHSGFKYFFKNVRDVIRYMNILRFNFSAIGKEVNIIDLMAITAFQVFEPKIYELIKNNPEMFTGQIRESISYGDSSYKEKATIQKYIETSYGQLEKLDKEAYLKLLQEIFIKVKESFTNTIYTGAWQECRKKAKLCSPEFFDLYFKLSLKEDSISKTQMHNYVKSLSNENELYEIVKKLNQENKIYQFLDRLHDYIYDIDINQTQTICNVLFDLGDTFPEIEGMWVDRKEWKIGGLIYQLLNRIENKDERFNIIKESIQKATNSIDILVFEVTSLMQQHGEYDKDAKPEYEQLVTNEHLQHLKEILKDKIKDWTEKYSFVDDKISLSLLYIWKRLDEETLKKFINEKFKNKKEILYFLKIFISVVYRQSLWDYTTSVHKKFNYKSIGDFIDYDFIEKQIRELNVSECPEDIQNLVKMFLDHFDGKVSEENDF